MKRLIAPSIAIGLMFLVPGCGGGGGGSTGGVPLLRGQAFVTGLNAPMQYASMPGQPTIALVIERDGVVRAVVNDTLQSTPVMDISGDVNTSGEGGLLGIAYDPQFASNRHFFLHFLGGPPRTTRVVRYTMNPDWISANAATAQPIFAWSQEPFGNHKGGSINFGSDGLLYLAMGDGGSGNDPNNHAQNPAQLLGKLLRIDPSGDDFPSDPENNYAVPASNPFVGTSGVRGEIWGFGLRNPFRWSIDSVNGALIVADVGQDGYEEINYEPDAVNGGRNYGWRLREGFHATGNAGPAYSTPFKDPFIEIPQSSGRSVIGGFVYRGSGLPSELSGEYFFGDYITNRLWSVDIAFAGGEALPMALSEATEHTASVGFDLGGVVSISPDANGEPVVVELNNGRLVRLLPPAKGLRSKP